MSLDHVFGPPGRTALHFSVFSRFFVTWFVTIHCISILCFSRLLSRFVADFGGLWIARTSSTSSDFDSSKFPPHIRSQEYVGILGSSIRYIWKGMVFYGSVGAVYDIIAQDAFFQPYLPLQQIDILKQTKSWLAGSTNSIVTQQQEVDLLVDVSTEAIYFMLHTY